MKTSPSPPQDWDTLLRQHRDAADLAVGTANLVPPPEWDTPVAAGKWSPAQVVEHLRLTYVALRRELATGQGMRIRTSWVQRQFIRILFLRRILRTGRFPSGAKAVKEIYPAGGPFSQINTSRELAEETRAFEQELTADPGKRITHPLFGPADAATALRFCTLHLLHHQRQIADRETAHSMH